MSTRFRYLGQHGREIEINTTDELVRAYKSGAIARDTLLYDAYGGGWAPARSHSALMYVQPPAQSVAPSEKRPQAPVRRASAPLITPPPKKPQPSQTSDPDGQRRADDSTTFTLAESTPEATADVVARLIREREPAPGFGPGLQGNPGEPSRAGMTGTPMATGPVSDRPMSERVPTWAAQLDARVVSPRPSVEKAPALWSTLPVAPRQATAAESIPGWLVPVRVVRSKLGPYGTVAAATLLFMIALAVGKSNLHGSPPERLPDPAPVRVSSAAASELSLVEADAFEDMIDAMERRQTELSIEEVPSAWLEGIYLADAGRFPDVREYWDRYATFVQSIRVADEQIFRESLLKRLHAQGLSESEVSMRLARALRTFNAEREHRTKVFDGLLELSVAAIDLHAFLLEHEHEISYEPANAGVSREPVTEAVPESRQLAEQMNERLDRVFLALEATNGTRIAPRDDLPLALRRGLTSNNRPSMR